MHGTLDVQSVFNEGSHFYIRLPLASKSKIVFKKTAKSTNENFKKLILGKILDCSTLKIISLILNWLKIFFQSIQTFSSCPHQMGKKV